MNDQTTTPIYDVFMSMAKQRNSVLAEQTRGEGYDEACNELLKPLEYHANGNTFYGLQLPQIYPSMTTPDVLAILEWYYKEGSIVRTGSDLVEVHANFGDIVIPMHPKMHGSYRVVQILKSQNDSVKMGDLLIILQKVAHQTITRQRQKPAAA